MNIAEATTTTTASTATTTTPRDAIFSTTKPGMLHLFDTQILRKKQISYDIMIYVLRKFYLRYTWTNNYNYGLYSYNYNSSAYNIFHYKDGYATFNLKLKSGEELCYNKSYLNNWFEYSII